MTTVALPFQAVEADEIEVETGVELLPDNGLEPPFSKAEEKRRRELEGLINRHGAAFVAVGMALKEIQQRRLYRKPGNRTEKFTFAHYCREVFEISKQAAYQLIGAAQVVENVRNCGQISWVPANEAQARPLAGLPPEKQVEAWEMAVKTAPEGKITAKHVKKIATEMKGLPVAQATQKVKEAKVKDRLSPLMKSALDSLMTQVQDEALHGWKQTDPKFLEYQLRGVLAALEGDER